ncbi:hypothetical protein QQ045_009478 [Rhodiola kirilowii]
MNLALLAKQGWRILTKPELLVSKVFKTREWREGIREPRWWDKQAGQCEEEPLIFCDGYYDQETKMAGAGVVLLWRGAVSRVMARWFTNISCALEAEFKAVSLGMELAKSLKVSRGTIFSDSSEVIWALNLGCWRGEQRGLNLERCFGFLDEHKEWLLGCINRESNKATDWLARKSRVDKWWWMDESSIPRGIPFSCC